MSGNPSRPPRWRAAARRAGRVAAGCGLFLLAYGIGFWTLELVPVNTGYTPRAVGVEVWVASNRLHTEFILPVRTPAHDWSVELPAAHFPDVGSCTHVGFGWGDRGFFLEAREVRDVRLVTALRALSYTGRSAVHVTYQWAPDPEDRLVRRLVLDDAQHRALIDHIRASFDRDAAGAVRPIPGYHYWKSDAFYEGVGRYGLFYTCNTWTNEALRRIGVRTALYAVFADGVMRHLR